MIGNSKKAGSFRSARPWSGDVLDRLLAANLRKALFGIHQETLLGRLRLDGPLGSGGMGTVLAAFDPVLDRPVAVKMLRAYLSDDKEQLLREARVLAKLDHPNIVSIYDVVENDDRLYLVMEQIQGSDLRTWMQPQRDWQDVVELFIQIGRGLASAHRQQIIHGDIKPENIVVSENRPRLIDFGLASQHNQPATLGGTRSYLAPERHQGGRGSAAADQYAFFATLVEAIEGRLPTTPNSIDDANTEMPRQSMPTWLAEVACQGLNPDPSQRFPDMEAALLALSPRPSRQKRIRVWVASAITVAAVASLATLVLSSNGLRSQDNPCTGSSRQTEAVWSPTAREHISTAFTASGINGADQIGQRVIAGLDDYFNDWVRLRSQSCLATRVDKEQSPEVFDLSMQCFDQRLQAVAGTIELFTKQPNQKVVNEAVTIITGLEPLAPCVNRTALKTRVPLPANAAIRAQIETLQDLQQQVLHHERRGEFKQALALSSEIVPQALELGYAPLSARILLTRGGLLQTANQFEEAEKTFHQAASAAARANDDDRVAGVWIRVLDLLVQQSRFDEALAIEAVAITSAERVAENRVVQARLQNTLGGIYLMKSRYDEALEAYEKALAWQQQLGAGPLHMVPAVANVGLAKWNKGDLQGAQESMTAAYKIAIEELGSDHSLTAYVLKNRADLARSLGNLEQATDDYLEIIRIWSKTLGPKHPNLALAYESLAEMAQQRGDFTAAHEHINKALKLREDKLGPDHVLVLQALSVSASIGLSESTRKSLAEATATIKRGLDIYEKVGKPAERQAVFILGTRAKLHEQEGNWRAAIADHDKVISIRMTSLGPDHISTAYSLLERGNAWVALGKPERADPDYAAAQKTFDKSPNARAGDGIEIRMTRASVFYKRGLFRKATRLLEEAVEMAEESSHSFLNKARFALIQSRYASGEQDQALASARALHDSIRASLKAQKSEKSDESEAMAAAVKNWLSENSI